MHEASLMENMLALATEYLAPHRVERVNTVTVRIGRLANVLPDALEFAFSAMTREGLFAGAGLILVAEPYQARCRDCAAVYDSAQLPPLCPECGGHGVEILSGAEIYLDSIDFEVL
ncbi:MAG: hydrogenase maturation nickel metallochaperone HypA [Clostridiales bacterium]|nr:hydrogenase maturation nickel metallochaperone HypA [Clostridiales bacterium]